MPTDLTLEIPGWGFDRRQEDRPGVPMEAEERRPVSTRPLAEQRPGVTILTRAGLERPTPVFGTAQPPRGMSGLLRRVAYRLPEHHAGHWLLLLGADRADVAEHRLSESLRAYWPYAVAAAALGLAAVAGAGARRSG